MNNEEKPPTYYDLGKFEGTKGNIIEGAKNTLVSLSPTSPTLATRGCTQTLIT